MAGAGGTSIMPSLVVIRTIFTVAPGLLSLPAWEALRAAHTVLAASAEHLQLPALDEAGIAWQLVSVETAEARAARLVGLLNGEDGPVVWLASQAGDDDLI